MPRASAALDRLLLFRLRTLRMKFFSNCFTASSKRIPRVIIWSIIASTSIYISFLRKKIRGSFGCGVRIADCGLRIADLLNLNRQSEIAKWGEGNCRISSIRSLQSAICNRKIVAGEQAICFEILFAGHLRDFRRKRGRGRSLIPIECLEVIANKLLIERRLRSSRGIDVPRPEPG